VNKNESKKTAEKSTPEKKIAVNDKGFNLGLHQKK